MLEQFCDLSFYVVVIGLLLYLVFKISPEAGDVFTGESEGNSELKLLVFFAIFLGVSYFILYVINPMVVRPLYRALLDFVPKLFLSTKLRSGSELRFQLSHHLQITGKSSMVQPCEYRPASAPACRASARTRSPCSTPVLARPGARGPNPI